MASPVVRCRVMARTVARYASPGWPHPDEAPNRPSLASLERPRGRSERSEGDDQLVVDLDELDDHVRELSGDQVLVGWRACVGVVGGLIGEVLNEQPVVNRRRIPVHPERQGTVLDAGALGREFLHDRLGSGLHAVLELDGKHLGKHGTSSWSGAAALW